ncbi:MAG: AAA family ATPase [Pseudobdellovibrionaceae bacterium]|nr:AAA family ATPase [Bdellovibrionales bacterium]USN47683.1 MAG: AAA family ATPase [Pseudobdellovibrionaceae bacterium]
MGLNRGRVFLRNFLFLFFIVAGSSWSPLAQADVNEVERLMASFQSGDVTDEIECILYAGNFQFEEVVEALLNRYELEIIRAEHDGVNPQILKAILQSLQKMATQTHEPDVKELETMTRLFFGAHDTYEKDLRHRFSKLIKGLENRDKKLPSIHDIPGKKRQLKLAPASGSKLLVPVKGISKPLSEFEVYDRISKIQQWMNKSVIGQADIIEKVLNLEYRKALYGLREDPEVLLLMGLPGTGKDTTARNYVDAMHEQKGAWREHMYTLPVTKTEADLWKLLGSATGYVGSDNFPPFLQFLVDHSGGRYQVKTRESIRGDEYYVAENPKWHPGVNENGSYSPENAVVYVDEFHNWSKEAKDAILKQGLEKGKFEINNPNGGLAEIYVPITFIVATNDGIGLVTSREPNGQRFGPPLDYEEMVEKWETVNDDVAVLRNELSKANGETNSRHSGGTSPGISEELLNRIPDRAFALMRPLSPIELQEIVRIKLREMAVLLSSGQGAFGTMKIEWTEKLVEFVQSYRYVAEDNARPMADRLLNLIERTLIDAVREKKFENLKPTDALVLDVEQLPDHTWQLKFIIKTADGVTAEIAKISDIAGVTEKVEEKETFSLPIKATLADRDKGPISDERVDELLKMPEFLNSRVFNIERISERLGTAVLDAEEGRAGKKSIEDATEPARSFMFLGPSSTGKTEAGKAIDAFLNSKKSDLVTIDFSQVVSKQDIKTKILGSRDALGNSIPSDFMKHYDRKNGRLTVIFDEIANAPLEVLKALYDIFREPVVTTFSDGKPRVMSNVTIILTGNAGEELFASIPRHVPEVVQQEAMTRIHQMMMQNPDRRRKLLESYFSEAFINRIGEPNIFFFAPLGFKAIRQLTQLKISQAVGRLAPQDGRRGWNLSFYNEQDYVNILSAIEDAGFILREQGASIDRFVREDFEARLRHLLLTHKIPSNTDIVIKMGNPGTSYENVGTTEVNMIHLEVHVKGHVDPLQFDLRGKQRVTHPDILPTDQVLTAFHEAGHELVRQIYLGDLYDHELITIVPGVTEIAGEWIYYAGLASHQKQTQASMTREVALREMAVLFGGEVAQTLVTKGARHDAGKSNDMERATKMAYVAILNWGLSEAWGPSAVHRDVIEKVLDHFKAGLTSQRRKLLDREVDRMLKEARELARLALLTNIDNALIPMGQTLAEKGTLNKDDLNQFYKDHSVVKEGDAGFGGFLKTHTGTALKARMAHRNKRFGRDGEFLDSIPQPSSIANIVKLTQAKKQKQVDSVEISNDIPFAKSLEGYHSLKPEKPRSLTHDCRSLLSA